MNGIAICIEWKRIGRDGMDNCCFLYMYSSVASDFEIQNNLETTGFLLSPVSVFKRHVGWIYAVRFLISLEFQCALTNKAELPQSSHWLVTSLCSLANQWIWAYFFRLIASMMNNREKSLDFGFPQHFQTKLPVCCRLGPLKKAERTLTKVELRPKGRPKSWVGRWFPFFEWIFGDFEVDYHQEFRKSMFFHVFSSFCSSIFFFSLVFQK